MRLEGTGPQPMNTSRLIFIGCGPVPSSLILLNRLAGIRSVGIDISEHAVAFSRKVIRRLELEKEIDIFHGDETLLRELDWDMVLVAAELEEKATCWKTSKINC